MLFIVIGNAVVFLFSMMDTTRLFLPFLYFSPQKILEGQIWRLITFVFVPSSTNLLYLALFLYFYYFIGSTLERQWGAGKFTIYYLSGVLLTIIYGFIAGLLTPGSMIYLSANFINLSLFFAFATLFPENRVLLFFIVPIKIKWLALLNAAFFLFQIITMPFPLSLLPVVALLNYLVFCGEILLSAIGLLKNRVSPRTISFKKAVKNRQAAAAGKPYTRKCSVCGRTDTDNPGLEFRYCSRCEGYHCFCVDHINSHVHFTE